MTGSVSERRVHRAYPLKFTRRTITLRDARPDALVPVLVLVFPRAPRRDTDRGMRAALAALFTREPGETLEAVATRAGVCKRSIIRYTKDPNFAAALDTIEEAQEQARAARREAQEALEREGEALALAWERAEMERSLLRSIGAPAEWASPLPSETVTGKSSIVMPPGSPRVRAPARDSETVTIPSEEVEKTRGLSSLQPNAPAHAHARNSHQDDAVPRETVTGTPAKTQQNLPSEGGISLVPKPEDSGLPEHKVTVSEGSTPAAAADSVFFRVQEGGDSAPTVESQTEPSSPPQPPQPPPPLEGSRAWAEALLASLELDD